MTASSYSSGPGPHIVDDGTHEEVGDVVEVRDDGDRLVGELCRVEVNGHGTSWKIRDSYYAEWGDVPGRPSGWHGEFATREQAETFLRRELQDDVSTALRAGLVARDVESRLLRYHPGEGPIHLFNVIPGVGRITITKLEEGILTAELRAPAGADHGERILDSAHGPAGEVLDWVADPARYHHGEPGWTS